MKILAMKFLNANARACLTALLRAFSLPVAISLVAACANSPGTTPTASVAAAAKPLDFYRCEYGIEFSAKFVDNTVTLDSSRGYDVLFKDSKASASPASPSITPVEYSNPRMNATFNLGVTGGEAVLRYPLLPLVSRCVRE
jgi:hypothetical protein